MRHLLIKTLAGSGLLLTSLTASAQYYPRPEQREFQEEREHGRVFDRLRADLDRVQATSLPFTADRSRVIRAREEVNECQRMLSVGDYDRREFDEAIVAVQRVAQLNRLSDNTRDLLLDDVRDLRRVQSRFES